jgi:hypothetical protein
MNVPSDPRINGLYGKPLELGQICGGPFEKDDFKVSKYRKSNFKKVYRK